MDGYAVRAADTADAPVRLRVVDELAAGRAPTRAVGTGEAIRIMTGAPMPDGADAIVMVEVTHTRRRRRRRRRARASSAITSARRAATSPRAPRCSRPARCLTPAHIGVLASLDVDDVLCHPRPRVGVSRPATSSSSRVRSRSGRIRDSNRPMLLAVVEESGFDAGRLRHRARRRGRDRAAHHRRGRRVRRAAHERRGVDGRLRLREGRARTARRGTAGQRVRVVAGRDQAGQAARVRHPRRGAGVRAAGQPGVVARQLRAVRPAGAAAPRWAGRRRSSRSSAAIARTAFAPPARRQAPSRPGPGRRGGRPLRLRAGRVPGEQRALGHGRGDRPGPASRTARAWTPATRSRSLLLGA